MDIDCGIKDRNNFFLLTTIKIMKTEEIKKQVQIIETAKVNAEAAELSARQVRGKIEEQSAKAVRLLRQVIENAERTVARANSDDAHHVRQMMEDMRNLQSAVVDFGLGTDFGLVAHKLGILQEDLTSTSQALQRITPQD